VVAELRWKPIVRPMTSGFGEGGLSLGLLALATALYRDAATLPRSARASASDSAEMCWGARRLPRGLLADRHSISVRLGLALVFLATAAAPTKSCMPLGQPDGGVEDGGVEDAGAHDASAEEGGAPDGAHARRRVRASAARARLRRRGTTTRWRT
jgi:hypothetical protein